MAAPLPPRRPDALVAHYLERLVAGDWEAVSACVAPDVVRYGPFADTYRGRDRYLAFLAALMPTLAGYSMEVHRVVACTADTADSTDADPVGANRSGAASGGGASGGAASGGAVVMAELSETVELDGRPVLTEESLVFDFDDDGCIARIAIYIRQT